MCILIHWELDFRRYVVFGTKLEPQCHKYMTIQASPLFSNPHAWNHSWSNVCESKHDHTARTTVKWLLESSHLWREMLPALFISITSGCPAYELYAPCLGTPTQLYLITIPIVREMWNYLPLTALIFLRCSSSLEAEGQNKNCPMSFIHHCYVINYIVPLGTHFKGHASVSVGFTLNSVR